MASCCCDCDRPAHKHSTYAETCHRCNRHRPTRGRIRWVPEDWTHGDEPNRASFTALDRALDAATDSGTLDLLAADIPPDTINAFCDAVHRRARIETGRTIAHYNS